MSVDLARQLLPGTFEHALNHLLDHAVDLATSTRGSRTTRPARRITISHFISTRRDDIAPVYAAVLAVGNGYGLIGREMFAVDGVKLASNASRHRSGTRATDALELEPDVEAKTTARIVRATKAAQQLLAWLAKHQIIVEA